MRLTKSIMLCELFTVFALTGAVAVADDFSKLGKELTPWGAPKAGNADGSIPAWDGGITSPPAGFDPKNGYISPLPDEKPLYTITASNYSQYASRLPEGNIELLKRNADYKINVYPSHRTHALTQAQYDAIAKEAPGVKLTQDGNGYTGTTKSVVPFPQPKVGLEIYHNVLVRSRGGSYKRRLASFPVQADGNFTPSVWQEDLQFYWNMDNPPANLLYEATYNYLSPSSIAGGVTLVREPIDKSAESRKAWAYNPGTRRVLRAPEVGYDSPATGTDGLLTQDSFDGINGSPERFEWKLVGKEEMIVPYNNFKLTDKSLKYTGIVGKKNLNPDLLRYELHRVYVLEGTLKSGARHIYSKRRLLVDEDSFQPVHVDNYDGRGELWRVQEIFPTYYYDCPCTWTAAEVSYDLQSGRYFVAGLANQEQPVVFNQTYRPGYFDPSNMKRLAR